MRDVIRLIQDIRQFLTGTPGSPPAEALAPLYVRWRQEAANRLEACARVIGKGSDYSVLQIAEAEPPLLELVAQLTFAEEPQWLEYCRQNKLPLPVSLDSRTLRALNEIYAKGISPNSPLYTEYRSAVTSRDNERALAVIRSIVRLNPGDANAQAELARWQNKKLINVLDSLKQAVVLDDREAVLALTKEAESLGIESKLAGNEVYRQGLALRTAMLQERALSEVAALLNQAERSKLDGNWREVSANSGRVRLLQNEHSLNLSQEQQTQLSMLERFTEKQRAEAGVRQDFDKALAALVAFADKVDTRLLTAATLSLEEAQKLEATFADFWKRVERFQLPVPEGLLARLQGIGQSVAREAARKRGVKKAVRMTVAGVCLVALGVAAWVGYASWRAQDYVSQLNDFQSRGLAAAAAKLVEAIPSSAPWGATSVPALRAAMEEKRQWARKEFDHLQVAEAQLQELEKATAAGFTDLSPGSLHAKLQTAGEDVGKLTADLAEGPKKRLGDLQNKADQHFTALRESIAKDAQKNLQDLASQLQQLDFNLPVAELVVRLSSVDETVEKIASQRHPAAPELKLPADIDASAQKLQNQVDVYAKEMTALAQVKQQMGDAKKLEAYKLALTDYSNLRFTEAGSAARVLADFPTADSFGAKLLCDGDATAWELAKKEARTGCKFYPEDVADSELRKIMSLREDPKLNAPGPAKPLLDAMLLNSLTDPSGDHYQKPLISTLDSLVRHSSGDPVAKAYLMLNIYTIMSMRGDSWGLHYCPQLMLDMKEIKAAIDSRTLQSGDWLLPEVREKFAAKLTQVFEHMAQEKTYMEQAREHLNWVSGIVSSGITYIGHVDEAHDVRLIAGTGTSTQVWGLAENGGMPVAIPLTDGMANKEEISKLRKWSPLVKLPTNHVD